MHNNHTHTNRRTVRALAVLIAALATPATALAHAETAPRAQGANAPASIHDNPLRDGKYLAQPAGAYGITPAQVAAPSTRSGHSFNWTDASIGAASAAGALALLRAAQILPKRRRNNRAQRELSGAISA
jgi:hypothetical protein